MKMNIYKLLSSIILIFLSIPFLSSQCNPLDPARGFSIFTKDLITFNGGHAEGRMATGGNLVVNTHMDASAKDVGNYTVAGENVPVSVYVGGTISGNGLIRSQHGYIKIGNYSGFACTANSGQLQKNGQLIAEKMPAQSCSSVTNMGTLNINQAFTELAMYSSFVGGMTQSATVTNSQNPDRIINIPNSGVGTYILNTNLDFLNRSFSIPNLSDNRSVIINILDATSGSYNWNINTTQFYNISNAQAKNILINFPNLTGTLRITNIGGNIQASILAPHGEVRKQWSGNIEGQVIAREYFHQSGESHYAKFQSCMIEFLTLPIELVAFNANSEENAVNLTWSSAEEVGFSHFEVQASQDGIQFETLGSIPAKGSNSDYLYIDDNPYTGVSYYRLIMVDNDGNETFSEVRSAFIKEIELEYSVYPNPVVSQLIIDGVGENDKVTVYNLAGIKVADVQNSNHKRREYDVTNLEAGVYFVSVYRGRSVETKKILVTK